MHKSIIHVADGFWNIRGSFKIRGIVDVGTQVSLVRRKSGKFVFLDSYTLSDPVKRQLDEITHGGKDVEAILNVHPFHTLHVRKMHEVGILMQDLPVEQWIPRTVVPLGFALLALRFGQAFVRLARGERTQLLHDEAEAALRLREQTPQLGEVRE